MNKWINYNIIYNILSGIFYRDKVWRLIPELAATENLPADLIRRRTESLLIKLLDRAYKNSPFFQRRLLEAGYILGGPFDHSVFSRIQPMMKQDIRAFPQEMSTGNSRINKRSTSGSTGEPLVFDKDLRASFHMDAAMHQVYGWYGVRPGDPEGRFWGRAITPSSKLKQVVKDHILNRRRLSSFEMGERECDVFLKTLRRFRPKYFYGYPNAMVHFAEYLSAVGHFGEELGLKVIICTGEILFPHHRAFIEKVFRCPVANEYGSTENGILAFQCPKGKLHVMAQNIFLEIVDNEGIPKQTGETGKVLVTEFNSIDVTFIRYSLGDLGALTDEKCLCGRTYPVLEIKNGRIDNFIITKSGMKVYDAILAYSFKADFIKFRGYQYEVGKICIEYMPKKGFHISELERLSKLLKNYLGEDMEILFIEVPEILFLPSGKLQYFVPLGSKIPWL